MAQWSRAVLRVLCLGCVGVAAAAFAADSAASSDRADPAADAGSERRLALVVGNNAYPSAPLTSPVNDARAMAKALTDLGFSVREVENTDRQQLSTAIAQFVGALRDREAVGLFYFAGHGAQSGGRNFLIPVDARIRGEADIQQQGYDLQVMLDHFADMHDGMNIVILDACRDNPFVASVGAHSSGLASIDAPPGTLAAFAAAPGHVALEEDNGNGVYTRALLSNIETPGLPVEEIFKRVRKGVLQVTHNQQVPWENTSLVRDFYFRGAVAGSGFRPRSLDSDDAAWDAISGSHNVYDFITYLKQHPETPHRAELLDAVNANLARLKPAPPTLNDEELTSLTSDVDSGLIYREINPFSAAYFGLEKPRGVIVATVEPHSLSERVGLKPGDILLAVNGKPVADAAAVLALNHTLVPGEYVEADLWRNRSTVHVSGLMERASLERILIRVGDDDLSHGHPKRARAFFTYVAERGDEIAQTRVGTLYLSGLGVPRDLHEAEKWFQMSAEQGFTTAAALLAYVYLWPVDAIKNDAAAYRWARFSADRGDPDGIAALALATAKGAGTEKNLPEAVRLARIAADQGEPFGMVLLGIAYEKGLGGLPLDLDQAKFWYGRAADLHFEGAKETVERIERLQKEKP